MANDTSMLIEQDWLFCYNHEEVHMVFKIVGVAQKNVMKSMAFPKQWEVINKIDHEVILDGLQKQLTSATKHFI